MICAVRTLRVDEGSRQHLWLAAWVMGFAVAMSCLLISFKHRAAIDALQRERLQLVASTIGDSLERGLGAGQRLGAIDGVPQLLEVQRRSDPLIEGIDVADGTGVIAYSTDAARKGRAAESAWRLAMRRAKADTWRARAGADAAEAMIVRSRSGESLAHVVVRYRLERWDVASAGFARHLALWGAVIAILGTLGLYFMLRYLHARLDGRLGRIREALASGSANRFRPGSLRADAAAARAKIDEAERLLQEAHEALIGRGTRS